MDCLEHEGKALFERYGIAIPRGAVLSDAETEIEIFRTSPVVVKAQVHVGGRGRVGGIRVCASEHDARDVIRRYLGSTIAGEHVARVLIEEHISAIAEYYVSFSYDTATRSPALAVSARGGVGVVDATLISIDARIGITDAAIASCLAREALPMAHRAPVTEAIQKLWRCFDKERLLLAEVNPLFITHDGRCIAGDAKVVLDDDVVQPNERRFLSLGGDIAVLASGGGASLLNIDALLAHGGRPANYTEYSGNPSAEVVRELTVRVLSQSGIRGCWAVGGTANFTDIYETMCGFVDGLRRVTPKPTYPIVVRRDGPRQAEAFAMLREIAEREGYQLYMFGSETPMEESARLMVKLAYGDTGQ